MTFTRIFFAILILIVLQVYFTLRVAASIRNISGISTNSKAIKTGIVIFLLLLNAYPLYALIGLAVTQLSQGGRFLQPEGFLFNYFVFFPFIFLTLIMVQVILFLLIIDILKLLLLPVYKKYGNKIKPAESWIIAILALLTCIYVPARVYYDFNVVKVRQVEFKKAGLPEELNNFRITFISDLQADAFTNRKRLGRYIGMVNDTRPDLVLIGGDVITSSPDFINLAAEYLGKIKAREGVYSCIGDHDHWAYRNDFDRSLREVITALGKVNVPMYDNRNVVLKTGKASIGVTFVTSTYVERIGESLLDELTDHNHTDLKIMLTHQPSNYLIERANELKYDLFLAGHTHGGQITFLFPFYNLTFTQLETKYVKGDFRFGNMLMIITRGLGMSIVPFRYNSTPEITVITLKKG